MPSEGPPGSGPPGSAPAAASPARGPPSPARSLSSVSCGTLQPQPRSSPKPVSRQPGARPSASGSKGR